MSMRSSCAAPSRWDIGFIRRFMLVFGPLSSVFDFATFGVMLWVFHSGPDQFRTGWFVESLATQTLVIFAIRTRRVPFFRSHPSIPLVVAALGVVAVGAVLPSTPLAHVLGFQPLPGGFFIALAGLALAYVLLIELGKRAFYGAVPAQEAPVKRRLDDGRRHLRRRAAHLGHAPVALEVRAHRLR
jgi:Mg2+-importing ATPase